jgi:hypothetical protein
MLARPASMTRPGRELAIAVPVCRERVGLELLHGTIRIEEELDDPERFIEEFRAGKLRTR